MWSANCRASALTCSIRINSCRRSSTTNAVARCLEGTSNAEQGLKDSVRIRAKPRLEGHDVSIVPNHVTPRCTNVELDSSGVYDHDLITGCCFPRNLERVGPV